MKVAKQMFPNFLMVILGCGDELSKGIKKPQRSSENFKNCKTPKLLAYPCKLKYNRGF